MFQWVIEGQLARGQRPGYKNEHGVQVLKADVDAWIEEAKRYGIQSILCLLGEDHLSLYADLPMELVSYYRQNGFHVEHISARDHQWPPCLTITFKECGTHTGRS